MNKSIRLESRPSRTATEAFPRCETAQALQFPPITNGSSTLSQAEVFQAAANGPFEAQAAKAPQSHTNNSHSSALSGDEIHEAVLYGLIDWHPTIRLQYDLPQVAIRNIRMALSLIHRPQFEYPSMSLVQLRHLLADITLITDSEIMQLSRFDKRTAFQMLHLQICWLDFSYGPRVPFNEVAGNREIDVAMRLSEGYVVPHGSKGLELKPMEEGTENMRRFRMELKETWRAYKGLRARAEERLEIREGIRQGRARAREQKEMITQMRNLEGKQGLDRGAADVESAGN